ncbi:LOW QUALITY PROTEIN: calmodulin-binding receptor-like cytoplasmic kinase 2 [Elaeis guineensis]|uniref:LOW QUALITY PROTEIN: calmodulin-binding receptor-like cytoplasmic kinase 2 n=1 Tax=Elaeis guineensis var. tenera TaxID=51953 RepID=UPI003C6D8D1E
MKRSSGSPLAGQNPRSGGWKPSSAVGRSSVPAGRKTPDRWDLSQSSAASAGSKSSTVNWAVVKIVRSIGSCFGPWVTGSPTAKSLKSFTSPPSTPSGSMHGDSCDSRSRRSSRGTYSSGYSRKYSGTYTTSQKEPGNMSFTLAEIQRATKNFSPFLKIGQGGFGTVYKGTLDDGTLVAVKRAKKSLYDTHLSVEFQSEIKILARVEHLNLVRFFGYLEYEDERIVVVEYVPNGTLREHLDCLNGKHLDLAARLDVAIDVAHAVTYLHTYTDHPIIHRDVKSSNILLTETLRAKVADFGFARLGANEIGVTHVSTQVKGTAGYLDPEYLKTYQLTEKSDVFSFGVLLVELITGRRPIEAKRELKERITAKWAMKKFTEGNAIRTLDPNLPHNPATNLALEKILELALQCLAPTRQSRPSMRRCAEILWNIRKDYRELLSSEVLPALPSMEAFHHRREKMI